MLWSGAVLGFVAVLAAERLLQPLCELRVGSSIFGQDSYSLLGQRCTYTLDGETFSVGPSLARAVIALLLVAWLLSLVLVDRRGRTAQPR